MWWEYFCNWYSAHIGGGTYVLVLYMYVWLYVCVYVCMCVCMYVFLYVCMYVCSECNSHSWDFGVFCYIITLYKLHYIPRYRLHDAYYLLKYA